MEIHDFFCGFDYAKSMGGSERVDAALVMQSGSGRRAMDGRPNVASIHLALQLTSFHASFFLSNLFFGKRKRERERKLPNWSEEPKATSQSLFKPFKTPF